MKNLFNVLRFPVSSQSASIQPRGRCPRPPCVPCGPPEQLRTSCPRLPAPLPHAFLATLRIWLLREIFSYRKWQSLALFNAKIKSGIIRQFQIFVIFGIKLCFCKKKCGRIVWFIISLVSTNIKLWFIRIPSFYYFISKYEHEIVIHWHFVKRLLNLNTYICLSTIIRYSSFGV